MIELRLTDEELAEGRQIGIARNNENTSAQRQDMKVWAKGEAIHIGGASAELAVAKWSGLPWSGRLMEGDTFDRYRQAGRADVGEDIQVRARRKHWYGLIVYKKSTDLPNHRFVLACMHRFPPVVELIGWMWGIEAKKPQYWRDDVPRPNYFVPAKDLRPMETLLTETYAT